MGEHPRRLGLHSLRRDRFPNQKRRYIWFVSDGLAGNIPDPRTRPTLADGSTCRRSRRSSIHQPLNVPWPAHPFDSYLPDGGLAGSASSPSRQHVQKVKAEAATIVAKIRRTRLTPRTGTRRPYPQYRLFEHLLAYRTHAASAR